MGFQIVIFVNFYLYIVFNNDINILVCLMIFTIILGKNNNKWYNIYIKNTYFVNIYNKKIVPVHPTF